MIDLSQPTNNVAMKAQIPPAMVSFLRFLQSEFVLQSWPDLYVKKAQSSLWITALI